MSLIKYTTVRSVQLSGTEFYDEVKYLAICTIVGKTRVANCTLGDAIGRFTVKTLLFESTDALLMLYVPEEHLMQILIQGVVLNSNFGVYFCASKNGLLYPSLICLENLTLELALTTISKFLKQVLGWAYVIDYECVRTFSDPDFQVK